MHIAIAKSKRKKEVEMKGKYITLTYHSASFDWLPLPDRKAQSRYLPMWMLDWTSADTAAHPTTAQP